MKRTEQRRQRALNEIARLTHPAVWAWLNEIAERTDAGNVYAVLARLAERAYIHSHPERGPCANCGRTAHYSGVDRLCSECFSLPRQDNR